MKERWKENEQWEVEVEGIKDAEGEEDGTAVAAGVKAKARDGEGAAARNGAEE